MKNAMHDILLFGAGFATGAYFMHTVMRRAYDEKYRKEVQDLKAHWEKREANLDEEVEKKANQKGFELAMGPYRTESDPEDIRKPEQAIEIIEPDEFGADENYETSFLSFYADGKLVFDGEDEPMDKDDISRAIGDEALKHFGEFMPNTIFDEAREFRGCIIENIAAKNYGIPFYLVNLGNAAPDVIERRKIDKRVDTLEIY